MRTSPRSSHYSASQSAARRTNPPWHRRRSGRENSPSFLAANQDRNSETDYCVPDVYRPGAPPHRRQTEARSGPHGCPRSPTPGSAHSKRIENPALPAASPGVHPFPDDVGHRNLARIPSLHALPIPRSFAEPLPCTIASRASSPLPSSNTLLSNLQLHRPPLKLNSQLLHDPTGLAQFTPAYQALELLQTSLYVPIPFSRVQHVDQQIVAVPAERGLDLSRLNFPFTVSMQRHHSTYFDLSQNLR